MESKVYNQKSKIKSRTCLGLLLLGILLTSCLCNEPSQPKLDIWIGGDVHLETGGGRVLAPLAPMLAGAVGIVNLEGPVAEHAQETGGIRLVNSAATLSELKAAGVAVAGIANNHSGDAGPDGAPATAAALRKAGLMPAGGPAGVAVWSEGGLRVVVSAHDLTNGVPARLAEDLAAARRNGDLLIATFHVTGTPSYLPKAELRQAVEIALRAGARVVAAHGTHALAPVERRGEAVILWGLGNLAFACDCTRETEGLIVRLSLVGHQVTSAAVIPIEAGLRGAPAYPAKNPQGVFDLLEAIGSTKLNRLSDRALF